MSVSLNAMAAKHKMTYVAFKLGTRVHIDGGDMHGVITAVLFRMERTATYEVSYIHNGTQQQPWIEEWRLEAVP